MASYTMELREYIEMWSQDVEEMSIKDRIEIGRPKLFNFEYPIFDSNYKAVFETNFIRNFYMREIGSETEELFKFRLESWLRINMPYFNKLFESELISFDPLMNSKMDTDFTKSKNTDGTVDSTTNKDATITNNQTVNGTTNVDTFNRLLENNTPDSRLAITTADGSGVIEYASQINENDAKTSGINTNDIDASTVDNTDIIGNTVTDITELETFVQSRVGKIGSQTYSKMMTEYRQSLIRVENKIFAEMQQLFMLVY